MTLNSAWSIYLDVFPTGGAAEAGRAAAHELMSGNSLVRHIAERMFLEDDPTGEARRVARSTWSSLAAIGGSNG